MKRAIAVIAVAAVGLLLVSHIPEARAEGEVSCIMSPNGTTASPTTQGDGGTACSWVFGSAVIMQCEDGVVCYDPNASNGGVATVAGDLCANFNGTSDPILIGLNPSEKIISLIVKEVADGGATVRCKFAATRRRIPAP